MRRFWCVICLMAWLLLMTGSAQASGDPAFSVSTATAAPGDTVELTVSLKNNPGIASAKLEVIFPEELQLDSVTYNSQMGGMTLEPQVLSSPVTLNWLSPLADLEGDMVYATLTFAVAENAAAAEYPVTVRYDANNVFDLTEENVYFSVESGGVTVVAETGSENPDHGDGIYWVALALPTAGGAIWFLLRREWIWEKGEIAVNKAFNRGISLLLALVMLLGQIPQLVFPVRAENAVSGNELAGKKLSILGASISTYAGISNNTDYNSTIGSNAVYYTEGRYGVYADDTWWMQVANDLGLELLVNNAWSGSSLLYERNGTVGAYVDRCVQLHNNDGEEPDIIGIQMGTNDFQYYKDTLGTADIDYSALIVEKEDGGYTYAEPTTSLEAAAIVLHKISVRYPDAEIYYLNISQRVDGTDELIQSFNAELKQVVEHFGAHIVDIYGSAITMDAFDTYIGDGRVHPNTLGMDAYTEAFKRAVIANTNYHVETHTVSFELEDVTADYGDDRIVVSGDAFSVNLTAADSLNVTVTMGGEDITASSYANGIVSIDAVTADVTIIATSGHDSQSYRWEFDGTDLVCVEGGNGLTKESGTTTDGVFSNTCYSLEKAVVLEHDKLWSVEWKCEGTFQNSGSSSGARIFSSTDVNSEYNARYIFKSNKNGLIAMGEKTTTGSHNYGVALGDYGIDWTAEHTYLLENRIADDGSNMVYLWVDGVEIGAMNHYYVGTTDKGTTSDWISGKDFVFPYMGTDTHGFTNASIEYISVAEDHFHTYTPAVTAPTCTEQGYTTYTCECGDSYVDDYVDAYGHTYENGLCTGCGKTVSPYLQQLPEDIIGCTNLYDILTPVKGYYTATKYDTTNGEVLSVVIPVEPGDRIAASSFASRAENMGSVDGIRVTYLLGEEIVTSLSAGDVYNAYTADGYITVPEGVDTVSIPWWKPSDSNWLTLSQVSKNYAVHSPVNVSAQEPTCTESGYTAGDICDICGVSLSGREEITPAGHSYSGDICTVCGAVDLSAILCGKYVSILGDSISTFNGYSNDATVNTTIGDNGPRYDAGTADTKPGSYCLLESVDDTWWMDFANRTGMKLLVNNSWAGSQVFGGQTSDGRVIPAAYLDRCVNLHDNTLENNPGNEPVNPDVIFLYLGINDYNFNRSNVGSGAVDYAGLVSSDGTYVAPTSFGEAYGIMLHKMQTAYPNAQIFAMTLLPENLYSVDMTAWEQHNAYIRAAAAYYGIPVVDLAENCAITWDNYSGYMIDKIHPTTAGMELISDCIEAELQAYYQENPPHVHTYENGLCTGCGENNWPKGDYAVSADTMADGTKLVLADLNTVKTNKHMMFMCDVAELGDGVIRLGHGTTSNYSQYIEITADALRVCTYYKGLSSTEYSHGLEINGQLVVYIDVGSNGKATITIVAEGEEYVLTRAWSYGCNGEIFCAVEGTEVTNVDCRWYCDGFDSEIWFFGDSYFNTTNSNRWPYYMTQDGYSDLLLCGYGGMGATAALKSFKNALPCGTPKYAVWCMGMNNGDKTSTTPNATWLSATEEFLALCEAYGIAPILATIPSTPTVNNAPKNAWVKDSGYRYIDFDYAVVENYATNEWYEGFLSTDNVHPAKTGAEQLYLQVLLDFPELMGETNAECSHILRTVSAKNATCQWDGCEAFQLCTLCGKRFDLNDAALEVTEEELLIEQTGHTYENGICTGCGMEDPDFYIPGDINGDGQVNNKDLTRLFQYLSDYDVEVVEVALDVNGDGAVNNKDLTRLFQYLSDYDVELH